MASIQLQQVLVCACVSCSRDNYKSDKYTGMQVYTGQCVHARTKSGGRLVYRQGLSQEAGQCTGKD